MSINAKLLEFQKLNLTIGKDSTNPHYKSKYASLSHTLDLVVPELNKLGLVIVSSVDTEYIVTSIIDSESGDKIESRFPLCGAKAQDFGSSITYGRRYSIVSLLNLNVDDDDDGNEANTSTKYVKKSRMTDENRKNLSTAISENKFKDADSAIEKAKVKYEVTADDEEFIRNHF